MRPRFTADGSNGERRSFLRLAFLYVFCALLAGCGYHFAGRTSDSVSLHGKSIAVPVFANATLRPNVETVFSAALRDEVAWRSGGKKASTDTADFIITGTVLSYRSTPISYTADDRVREYRASLTVEASLRDRANGEVVWKGTQTLSQDYPVVDFPMANRPLGERIAPQNRIALQQNSEDAAIREVARKLAQSFYEKMTDGF